MHFVPSHQIAELRTAVSLYSRNKEIDMSDYQATVSRMIENSLQPDLAYLFSLPSGWDVLEVVKENSEFNVFREEDSDLPIGKVTPEEHGSIIRTLVLTPADGAEMRTMLGLPRWDRYIRVTAVLANNDQYLPLEAYYKGRHDSNEPVNTPNIINGALQILSTQQFKIQPEVSAPILPDYIEEKIRTIRVRSIQGHEKEEMVRELMSLDDLGFMEAVSQIIPHMELHNGWLNSEPRIAKRTWEWTQDHPEYKDKFVTAPWKTARSLPRNHRPLTRFTTPTYVQNQNIPY